MYCFLSLSADGRTDCLLSSAPANEKTEEAFLFFFFCGGFEIGCHMMPTPLLPMPFPPLSLLIQYGAGSHPSRRRRRLACPPARGRVFGEGEREGRRENFLNKMSRRDALLVHPLPSRSLVRQVSLPSFPPLFFVGRSLFPFYAAHSPSRAKRQGTHSPDSRQSLASSNCNCSTPGRV